MDARLKAPLLFSALGCTLVAAGLCALVGLACAGCVNHAEAHQAPEVAPFEAVQGGVRIPEGSSLRGELGVAAIAARPVRHQLNVPATCEADPARVARVSSPLPGRVVRLFVQLGQAVRQGAPLFELDSPDLAAAQSDWLKAKSAATLASRSQARQADLHQHGVGALKELEQAESDASVAQSELERAERRLRMLSARPGDASRPLLVRAPMAGRVIELSTSPGQVHNDASAALLTIADLSLLWVTASVAEKDLERVALGQQATVEFTAWPGRPVSGTVGFIGDVLVPETRTVKVRIAVANPDGRFKPGMFARVSLSGPERQELVVPPAALRLSGEQSFLFVERGQWSFERRPVSVGEAVAGGLCVTAGLSAGERIVTSNSILLP
jgi:membrane fusion protein, heavy metal efflux system